MKPVPVEPTEEQITAGLRAWFGPDGPFFTALKSQQRGFMASAYRAMIDAAPVPQPLNEEPR